MLIDLIDFVLFILFSKSIFYQFAVHGMNLNSHCLQRVRYYMYVFIMCYSLVISIDLLEEIPETPTKRKERKCEEKQDQKKREPEPRKT